MAKILIRSYQDPRKVLKAREASFKMGGNAGNLLYANGVQRLLSAPVNEISNGALKAGVLADPTKWVAKVNKRFDHYVIPMSNSFRFSFGDQLVAMTKVIRQLEMPVTVIGVGAQTTASAAELSEADVFKMGKTGSAWAPSESDVDKHNTVVHDFVEAVLEKSATIGVRGDITSRYLESLGFGSDRIDVIGCPSLYTWGPDLRVAKKVDALTRDSKISMNIDFRVQGIGAIIEKNVDLYPHLTSPVQDSKSARLITDGEEQFDMSKRDMRTPIHMKHRLYREGRLLFFGNPWGWIESFKDQEFAFGNRLHGNIAALLAGTPVHLLAHDSRTLEIAEYHGIPHSLISDHAEPPSAQDLYATAEFDEFNRLMPIRFQNYLEFLHRNGLTTVCDPGQDAAAFDALIAAGQRTTATKPKRLHPVQQLKARLRRG